MKKANGAGKRKYNSIKEWEEIQKNPKLMKEIDKFIKATTSIHKLPKS